MDLDPGTVGWWHVGKKVNAKAYGGLLAKEGNKKDEESRLYLFVFKL